MTFINARTGDSTGTAMRGHARDGQGEVPVHCARRANANHLDVENSHCG